MAEQAMETIRDVGGGVLFLGGLVPDRDQMAFAHALRVAEAVGTSLTVLECGTGPTGNFPVRQKLEQWGLLPAGSKPEDVAKLGFWVRKTRSTEISPRKAVQAFLARQSIDLLVMAHHGGSGLIRLGPSDPTAAESDAAALFITPSAKGFVEPRSGRVRYRRILIPVAATPSAASAVNIALSLARHFDATEGTFTLLHVGTEKSRPRVEEPVREGWKSEWMTLPGEPLEIIRDVAFEIDADLIVMTTEGRKGFLEALRGSTVERIVGDSPCPVLALPAR